MRAMSKLRVAVEGSAASPAEPSEGEAKLREKGRKNIDKRYR